MHAAIDFGTSNCLIVATGSNQAVPIPIEGESFLLKSHLFIPEPAPGRVIIDEGKLTQRITNAKRNQSRQYNEWERFKEGPKPIVYSEERLEKIERDILTRETIQNQKRLDSNKSVVDLIKDGAPVLSGFQALREHLAHQTPGRFIRSPKAFLGVEISASMQEFLTYSVSILLSKLRKQAEAFTGNRIENALIGRPINFHGSEYSGSNEQAVNILTKAASLAGFSQLAFEFEPYAAAVGALENLPDGAVLAVVDVGGGTTDCSIIRVSKSARETQSAEPLAFSGRRIGGLEFDRALGLNLILPHFGLRDNSNYANPVPKMFFTDVVDPLDIHAHSRVRSPARIDALEKLITQNSENKNLSRLNVVYSDRRDQRLQNSCELAKQYLCEKGAVTLPLKYIETDFTIQMSIEELDAALEDACNKIVELARQAVTASEEQPTHILFTGGASKVPILRKHILDLFKGIEVISADEFSAVSKGLATLAMTRFGN